MNRITYLSNGGKIANTIHCVIQEDTGTHLKVLINEELQRSIEKKKIIENLTLSN